MLKIYRKLYVIQTKTLLISTIGALVLVSATGGTTYYLMRDDGMATITAVEPFILHNKIAYQDCTDQKRTSYTKAGDKYNIVGGVAGGATGAIVAHALTGSPVILAGSAIAGVFGGQAIERHVKKPTAHTKIVENCSTQYRDEQVQAGYLVSFTHNNESGSRVLNNQPLDSKIPLTLLEAAPTPEQVIAKSKISTMD